MLAVGVREFVRRRGSCVVVCIIGIDYALKTMEVWGWGGGGGGGGGVWRRGEA